MRRSPTVLPFPATPRSSTYADIGSTRNLYLSSSEVHNVGSPMTNTATFNNDRDPVENAYRPRKLLLPQSVSVNKITYGAVV